MDMSQKLIFRGSVLILGLVIWLFPTSLSAQADDCLGYWKTIDDETKTTRSVVQIYKQGDRYFGKVVKLFRKATEERDPYCDACDDDDPRYKQRVLGMVILEDLEWDASDDEWDDGVILDPKKGELYDCYIALESQDKLKVRGFIGLSIIGRTQYWFRVEKPEGPEIVVVSE